MTTLRPLGPRVTLTASVRISTPRRSFSRASAPNLTSLADMSGVSWINFLWNVAGLALRLRCFPERLCGSAFEHAHDVGFLHDQELYAIDLHLDRKSTRLTSSH